MTYELFQEGATVSFGAILVSLIFTVIGYGAIPIIVAKTRKSEITKKSYRWTCFGWNILVIGVFVFVNGGASAGGAYALWTWIFSEWGIKILNGRGVLVDEHNVTDENQWSPGKVSECLKCGYQGDIDEACPKCGSKRRRYVYPEKNATEAICEDADSSVDEETDDSKDETKSFIQNSVEKPIEVVPESEVVKPEECKVVENTSDEAAPEEAKAHKASPAVIAAGVILAVALVAVLIALLIGGRKDSGVEGTAVSGGNTDASVSGEVSTDVTVPATIPEGDGDPTSVSCKGSYTVSDEEVIANKDVVVATAGEHELTLGQLQIYYWQEVSGFLSQYGYYASYFGLDTTLPLDSQMCSAMEGLTWQQYFLYSALNSWQSYQALDAVAEKEGFEMAQEFKDHVETIPQQLEEQAAANGYESAQAMMTYNVGAGPTIEDYAEFMEVYYHGYSYFNDFYSNATASQEEIDAMFAEHEAEYAEMGLTKDTKTVNVRHILIYPEGATSETVRTETFSEEAWAAGKAAAEEILNQWLAGDMTEESFAALAEEHSQDPGSAANGGLYTDVYEGDMVANFNDWCFDAARQVGDYGIVETEFGYHIMFYSGETDMWYSSVEADVISQKTNDMVDAALAQYPLTVYYDRIMLSMAEAFRVS